MSAFKHSAVSFGTSDTPPPEAGRNIGPISLHNAIRVVMCEKLPAYWRKLLDEKGSHYEADDHHELLEENDMTATYTFDVFSSLDGYGSYAPPGDWGGYWGKQGPDLLDHRLALFGNEQRMVFGATTFRQFVSMLASSTEDSEVRDPWVTRMRNMPATVVSTTLEGPLDWPNATVVNGDAVDVVARLKEESEVPLRSHGSLS